MHETNYLLAGVHVAQTAVSEVRWPVQRRYRERTLEEKVQDLSSQLRRIRAEVVASEFYKCVTPRTGCIFAFRLSLCHLLYIGMMAIERGD